MLGDGSGTRSIKSYTGKTLLGIILKLQVGLDNNYESLAAVGTDGKPGEIMIGECMVPTACMDGGICRWHNNIIYNIIPLQYYIIASP